VPDPLADVKREFRRVERAMVQALAGAVKEAAQAVLAEMQQLTAAIGHTPADLARLGHPYARRLPAGSGPFEDWITHHQSGSLHGGLRAPGAVRAKEFVEAQIHSTSPHTWYVVQDERASAAGKMRPRDFVTAALIYQEDAVAAIIAAAHASVHDVLGTTPGYRPQLTPINHGSVAADLPERD
jgi:hypothetical protein